MIASSLESWPAASRKRLALALYLDFVLLSVPIGLATWLMTLVITDFDGLSSTRQLFVFIVIEAVILRGTRASPGLWLLGMARLPPDLLLESGRAGFVVNPWVHSHERWWTILLGVLAILDGSKAMVRWTMWYAPPPLLGIAPPENVFIALTVSVGAMMGLVGAAILRLHPVASVLGPLVYAYSLLSALANWTYLPTWIGESVRARRAYQGRPIREEMVQFMETIGPYLLVVGSLLFLLWMGLVALRIRRVHQAGKL